MAANRVSTTIFLLLALVLLAGAGLTALGMLSEAHLALPSIEPAQREIPPLPGPHEPVHPREGEHFTANGRVQMAQDARAIIGDPNSQCNYYDCGTSSSVMRTCLGSNKAGDMVYAMQWLWYSTEARTWMEGSVWIQSDAGKAERYLRNQGCIP